MNTTSTLRTALLTGAAALLLAPQTANAAEGAVPRPTGTSTKEAKGQANDADALSTADIIVTGTRAASEAPITSSLATTQPQAAVSRVFIENVLPINSDFTQLALLTPGVTLTGTSNGIGLTESKIQIRGFQDGEFNVTYDSIPFADTNNPTHHSTAFFPSNTIETVVVNRGPGNASQLGQATYGGNLNIYSRAVSDKPGGQADFAYGSFDTVTARGEIQSGAIAALGGAKFVLTGQFLKSNGALTASPIESKNIFFKAVVPIGTSNTLTLLSTYNRNYYYQSDTGSGTCGNTVGASTTLITEIIGENCAPTSTIGIYGKNYGLVPDASVLNQVATNPVATRIPSPFAQSYFAFNRTDKTTDFSIIRLQSDVGSGITLDNRVYMYAYTNNTLSGQDATGRTANTVVTGFTTATVPVTATNPNGRLTSAVVAAGIPVYDKGNKYRVGGYIGQLNYEFARGRARIGGWWETALTDRRLINFDGLTGLPNFREGFNNGSGTAAANLLPATSLANIRYLQRSRWNQFQLFAELEYEILDGLVVTPGLKYVQFKRGITANVNQTSRTPIDTTATFKKTLPFLTANYTIMPNWTAYFQFAKGMYVPDLSSFYAQTATAVQQATLSTALGNLAPQTTTNYQFGTVYHGRNVTLDFAVYSIEVDNKIAANPDPAFVGTLINIGRVKYKGIEGGATYTTGGLTLFANGSLADAKSATTGTQIAKAAKYTAALGALYAWKGLAIAYTHKFIGSTFANEYNGLPGNRLYRIPALNLGDFNVSYDFGSVRVGVQVSNVFNVRTLTAIGTSANGAATTTAVPNLPGATATAALQSGYGPFDTLLFNPPRAATASVRLKF